MPDRGRRRRADRRRQCGGEDKARRIRAHRVDQRERARDIAAEAAKRLGKGAFDHVDTAGDTVTLGNAATAPAVHADGMDFVDVAMVLSKT